MVGKPRAELESLATLYQECAGSLHISSDAINANTQALLSTAQIMESTGKYTTTPLLSEIEVNNEVPLGGLSLVRALLQKTQSEATPFELQKASPELTQALATIVQEGSDISLFLPNNVYGSTLRRKRVAEMLYWMGVLDLLLVSPEGRTETARKLHVTRPALRYIRERTLEYLIHNHNNRFPENPIDMKIIWGSTRTKDQEE